MRIKLGIAALAVAAASVAGVAPAGAANVLLYNGTGWNYGVKGALGGNVTMINGVTERTDINSADYYDEYRSPGGAWTRASATWNGYTDNSNIHRIMITGLNSGKHFRVRANHIVFSAQDY